MTENLLASRAPAVLSRAQKATVDSPSRRAWQRFRRHRMALLGMGIMALLLALLIFAPWVSPYEPNAQDLGMRLQAPNAAHLMGTDELGRDVFTRILYGGRISLSIGLAAMAISITVGTLLGALSGFFGGWVDTAIMRLVDVVVAFPSLFLLIMLASFLGSSLFTIVLVIGLLAWMRVARLVRASFMSIKGRDYVTAAHCIGCPPRQLILRHFLPNALGPVIVAATIDVSAAILTESALSYLGLGVQPPTATWGSMLRYAQDQMTTAPWTAFFPGFMIFLVSIAINFIGDGLRDAFDPRQINR